MYNIISIKEMSSNKFGFSQPNEREDLDSFYYCVF